MNKSFIIPECAKVTNIKIQDNLITVYYEPIETPKEFIPKDGDFCTLKNNLGRKYFFIFKKETRYEFYFHAKYTDSFPLSINSDFKKGGTLTPATEAEKQTLLSEIDKAGFIWNAEKKRIEKKRWRAESACKYFYFGFSLKPKQDHDTRNNTDDSCFKNGNYFQTEQQVYEASCLIKELLFHFHEQDEILTKIKELLCVNN